MRENETGLAPSGSGVALWMELSGDVGASQGMSPDDCGDPLTFYPAQVKISFRLGVEFRA